MTVGQATHTIDFSVASKSNPFRVFAFDSNFNEMGGANYSERHRFKNTGLPLTLLIYNYLHELAQSDRLLNHNFSFSEDFGDKYINTNPNAVSSF